MDPENCILSLVPSETDQPLRNPEYQHGMDDVANALMAQGMKVSSYVELEESVGSETVSLGTFSLEFAKVVVPVLGTVVGAWLGARYGRKVRLKVGDIEAEARTVEEIEKLLARAKELRQPNP